jgi:adenylate cyclase
MSASSQRGVIDSQEVELKLRVSEAALPALCAHPLFAGAVPCGAGEMETTYYDTPDCTLRAAGIALRLRRSGDDWRQTVKRTASSAGGLSVRPEWEQPWNGSFDFSGVADARVRTILTTSAATLAPVFVTRVHRETRRHAAAGARIGLMLDRGDILAGPRRESLCELELELEAGAPADLFEFAAQLAVALPLFPDDRSKAARGYALLGGEQPDNGPVCAQPVVLARGQSPLGAFRDLAESCVRQWQGNVWGALADPGADPEYIHQLRVALRRLRSLLRLFAPVLPETFVAVWRRRLGDHARTLDAARDLDVLCDAVLAPACAAADDHRETLARLGAVLEAARAEARAAAWHHLEPGIQGRLLLGFMAALHQLPDPDTRQRRALVALAQRRLDRARRRVARRLDAARKGDPAQLHRLRIACKQLRYGLDCCAPLFAPKAVARYVRALSRVQDRLGYVHDLDVARARLPALAAAAGVPAAATLVLDWHAVCYRKQGKRALRDTAALLAETPPWQR